MILCTMNIWLGVVGFHIIVNRIAISCSQLKGEETLLTRPGVVCAKYFHVLLHWFSIIIYSAVEQITGHCKYQAIGASKVDLLENV